MVAVEDGGKQKDTKPLKNLSPLVKSAQKDLLDVKTFFEATKNVSQAAKVTDELAVLKAYKDIM